MGAGILSLHQSLGIIIGANVGTTVTGQIIRLLDLDASSGSVLRLFQPSTLAPVALVAGMVLIMGFHFKNAKSIGNIAVGFGILFSGLLNMTGAVNSLAESGLVESLLTGLGNNPFIGYLTGAGIAFALQSSSATIGILQTFSASGLLTFKAIYAVIVGIYLGDCVTTAIVCSIGAKAEARRVGIVNILFNLSKTVLVLLVVTIAHRTGLLDWLWDMKVNSGVIANTNTVFNFSCAVLLLPMVQVYEKLSRKILPDQPEPEDPYKEKLDALSPAFFNTPALALRSCYDLLLTVFSAARENIGASLGLVSAFDGKKQDVIMEQEGHIDRITDRLSRYIVELLPHLKEADYVAILNQYYRDASEFERLGDQAVRISDLAAQLQENEIVFSETAQQEIAVFRELLGQILAEAEQAFRKRDVEAAYRVIPLERAAGELMDILEGNHLKRMGRGECNYLADARFMNLLANMKRIAEICANIATATVIRVNPELAGQEHMYFENLHEGRDKSMEEEFRSVLAAYREKLPGGDDGIPARAQAPA